MSRPVDIELKKAFEELQIKMVETSKKIQIIDQQIQTLVPFLKRLVAGQHMIKSYPPETKIYESLSRMFLLFDDIDKVNADFKQHETKVRLRIEKLEQKKEYLERNLKESEDNIREMVQQRKGQQ